jgi:hypothetical protein
MFRILPSFAAVCVMLALTSFSFTTNANEMLAQGVFKFGGHGNCQSAEDTEALRRQIKNKSCFGQTYNRGNCRRDETSLCEDLRTILRECGVLHLHEQEDLDWLHRRGLCK